MPKKRSAPVSLEDRLAAAEAQIAELEARLAVVLQQPLSLDGAVQKTGNKQVHLSSTGNFKGSELCYQHGVFTSMKLYQQWTDKQLYCGKTIVAENHRVCSGDGDQFESTGIHGIGKVSGSTKSTHGSRAANIGVMGSAYSRVRDGSHANIGVMADIWDEATGGHATNVCFSAELPSTSKGSTNIGYNLQPRPGATGVIGMQFQSIDGEDKAENYASLLYGGNARARHALDLRQTTLSGGVIALSSDTVIFRPAIALYGFMPVGVDGDAILGVELHRLKPKGG